MLLSRYARLVFSLEMSVLMSGLMSLIIALLYKELSLLTFVDRFIHIFIVNLKKH